MLDQFKKAGITFAFSADSMMPEIPSIKDVFYSLRQNRRDESYNVCMANNVSYISNVHLVAAAVAHKGDDLTFCEVAHAICELCPEEAKCLFNEAYREAARVAGRVQELNMSRSKLITMCGCKTCADMSETA